MNETFRTKAGTELPITTIQGKKYLQVAQRIRWFREEKPGWGIETTVDRRENSTLARASIRDENGRVIAQATKFEDSKGFADHTEKAETGAVGRALALCGYGTQFATDLEEGERLADSPIYDARPVATPQSASAIDRGKNPPLSDFQIHCSVCGTELKKTKAGDAIYCPNYKDKAKGDHLYLKNEEVDSYLSAQQDLPY